MKLILPQAVLRNLRGELKQARRLEIGGLLLGEHIEGDCFRVVEATVQRSGGSPVHFVRDPAMHEAQLNDFFERTGNNFYRFNYMGEWHSHPSFEPSPSLEDMATMQSIVEDPNVHVNFLVLVIVRLTHWNVIKLSAMLFRPHYPPADVDISPDGDGDQPVSFLRNLLRRVFSRGA